MAAIGAPSTAVRIALTVAAGVTALLIPAASGVAAHTRGAARKITVFAASSLTNVFPAIDKNETYSFAGSNTLATQITLGAPADVFASANTSIPARLYAQGLVEKPVDFTRNALVIVVPE